MVRVKMLAGDADELLGEFEFEHLPRKGDEVTIPWANDPGGIRIFTVTEVVHFAACVEDTALGDGPLTVLRYCEEIC